jgi:hypothetical protein
MIALDAALVIIVIAAVTAGVMAVTVNRVKTTAIKAAPDRRLEQAVRLLDHLLAQHEGGYAMLGEKERAEARRIVNEYYNR